MRRDRPRAHPPPAGDALSRRAGGGPGRRGGALQRGQGRPAPAQRRPLCQRCGRAAGPAGSRLRGRRGHRPDERSRPARGVRPEHPVARRGRADATRRPRRVRAPRPGGDRRPLLRDGRLQGRRSRGLRLRQQPARGGKARRVRAGVRLPGLRPRLHPAPVLRREGAVSLGRAVRRRGRHSRHRPRRPGGVRGRRGARTLDPARRRADRLSGPAGADLLARLRRTPQARAALQRDGAQRRAARADRDRPRPPRFGLGRLALSRDRGDGGRVGRDRRLAVAERARQHLRGRLLGQHPPRRRGGDRALHPCRDGVRRRRHRPRGAEARAGADLRPGNGGDAPRRRGVRARGRGRRGARGTDPDAWTRK